VNEYWKDFIASLYSPESWLKVVIMLALLPFWWPTVKMMMRELLDSLNMEQDRRLAPGEDPFLSVPLASHRGSRDRLGAGGRRRPGGADELTPRSRSTSRGAPARGGASTRPAARSGFAPNRR